MGTVVWDSKLETGYAKIDEQHKALVDAYNRLLAAMNEGKGKGEVANLLVFLKDYTVSHFQMEEALMAQHCYPRADAHKAIHQDLVQQVGGLVEKFQKGTIALTIPLMFFLEDWLVKHIQGEDVRLAEFLRTSGSSTR